MPGFGSVGVWEVVVILTVVLLVFGAKRIPEIGAALGKGIREFKSSVREIEGDLRNPAQKTRELPRAEATRVDEAPQQQPESARAAETGRTE